MENLVSTSSYIELNLIGVHTSCHLWNRIGGIELCPPTVHYLLSKAQTVLGWRSTLRIELEESQILSGIFLHRLKLARNIRKCEPPLAQEPTLLTILGSRNVPEGILEYITEKFSYNLRNSLDSLMIIGCLQVQYAACFAFQPYFSDFRNIHQLLLFNASLNISILLFRTHQTR